MLNSSDSLKSNNNIIVVSCSKIFHCLFEVSIIILPFLCVNIKTSLWLITFNFFEILIELEFYFFEIDYNFRSFKTSKYWNFRIFAFSCKLELGNTNFVKITTSLFESIDFSKNKRVIFNPFSFFISTRSFLDNFEKYQINPSPICTTFDRVLKLLHAVFYISFEHIFYIDIGNTSFNDFITDSFE